MSVVPVQRVTDFMAGVASADTSLPSSSYRLGVRAGPLHEVRRQLFSLVEGNHRLLHTGTRTNSWKHDNM